MNILFLDVDGVLNNYISEGSFSEFNLLNLKELCSRIEFKIVLSSDWRRTDKAKNIVKHKLKEFDLRISSCTPVKLSLDDRKDEIRMWLNDNEWSKALIIDDMSKKACDPEMENVTFFRINYKLGLTAEDVDKICELFSEST